MNDRQIPRSLIVTFSFVLIMLILSGIWFYNVEHDAMREAAEHKLQTIAKLKVDQLRQWRFERLADAAVIMNNDYYKTAISELLKGDSAQIKEDLLAHIKIVGTEYRYHDILVTDSSGKVLVSIAEQSDPQINEKAKSTLKIAFNKKTSTLTPLHLGHGFTPPHISAVAPFFDPSGNPIGGIFLIANAHDYLFPLVQTWPGDSKTAETLIIRAEGDSVVFLNELWHQQGSALTLSIPLTETGVPAVMAVMGKTGIMYGTDYRGEKVISSISEIPDSPWFMISKIDESEALADWHDRAIFIIAILIILVIATGAVMLMLWQNSARLHLKKILEEENARIEERHKLLAMLDNIDDVVYVADPDTYEILHVNKAATDLWVEDIEGIKCHKYLQNRDEPCPFCSNYEIFGENLGKTHIWEFQNEVTKKWYRCTDKAIRWINGKMVRFEIASDITEIKNAEIALKESEKRFRQFFELSVDLICIADINGCFEKINPSWERVLGYKSEELTSKPFMEFVHPDDKERTLQVVNEKLEKGETVLTFQNRYLHKNGNSVWLEWTSQPNVQDGKTFAIARDITDRKAAEEILKESEERFRLLADNASDMIYLMTIPDGKYTYVSPAAEKIYGHAPKDFYGSPILIQKMLHPDWSEYFEREWAKILEGNPSDSYEYQIIHRDGDVRWIYQSNAFQRDKDGKITAIQGIVTDITERKTAQVAVLREKEYAESMLDSIPGVFYQISKEGKFVKWNREFTKVTGYSDDEMRKLNPTDLFRGEDKERIVNEINKVFVEGYTDVEANFVIKSGESIPYIFTGTLNVLQDVPYLLGVGLNISDLKETQNSLLQYSTELSYRNRIAEIFGTVQDEDMYAEVLDVVLEAMESKYGVFGYIDEKGDLIVPTMTRTIWDQCQVPDKTFIFPRDTWGDSAWPTSIREKRVVLSNEVSKLTPEGHIPVTRNVAMPIILNDEVIGLLQVANKDTDYTEQDIERIRMIGATIAPVLDARLKRDREEAGRIAALEDFKRSNQELEQFAYVASHDLQEPLRMVSSYTQLLSQKFKGQLSDKADRYIYYAVDGANRMQILINDLLSYSRVTTRGGDFEATDPHTAMAQALVNLRSIIDETGAIVSNDFLPMVKADPTQLLQVFQNLISNALKFKSEHAPRIFISGDDSNGYCQFSVKDNGIGIDEQFQEKVFTIFQRLHTREEYPGTGIGLALVKRIIDRHKGNIWFESKAGEGTTFYFTLQKAGNNS